MTGINICSDCGNNQGKCKPYLYRKWFAMTRGSCTLKEEEPLTSDEEQNYYMRNRLPNERSWMDEEKHSWKEGGVVET